MCLFVHRNTSETFETESSGGILLSRSHTSGS
jgi:hypothetical protein